MISLPKKSQLFSLAWLLMENKTKPKFTQCINKNFFCEAVYTLTQEVKENYNCNKLQQLPLFLVGFHSFILKGRWFALVRSSV